MGGKKHLKNQEEVTDNLLEDLGQQLPEEPSDTFKSLKAPEQTGALSVPEVDNKDTELRGVKISQQLRKRRMLLCLEATLMNVLASCSSAGIAHKTYYRWMNEDPEFRKEVDAMEARLYGKVEDKLKELVLQGKESSVHFWLRSRHPNYRPKQEIELPPGGTGFQTIEDVLRVLTNPPDDETERIDQQGDNREAVQDSQQTPGDSTVPAQCDSEALRKQGEEQKLNS